MKKTDALRVRLEPELATKMKSIKQQTGMNTSQVFRELLRNAEVRTPFIVQLSSNKNESSVTDLTRQHAAFNG